MRVLLIRHGHVEGIEPARFRGRFDVALSENGQAQARAVAARIAGHWHVRAVYTSPLRRCVDTADRIAGACNAGRTILETLNDIDYGSWEWKTHEEIHRAFPELFARWFAHPDRMRFPSGDSLQDLIARTAEAMRILQADHPDDTVVVVTHESACRAILLQALDQSASAYWRLTLHPCAISEFEMDWNQIRVVRINETCHLDMP